MENKNNNTNKQDGNSPLSRRNILIVVMALSLFCAAIVIFLNYPPKTAVKKPSLVQAGARDAGRPPEQQPTEAPSAEAAHAPAAPAQAAADNAGVSGEAQNNPQAKKDSKPKADKIVQDPLSRVALSLVGVDSAAEESWLGAVFDPSLPKSERQDLVDDLNEEGLPDPKHPTEEDLPVLFSRLEMLEELIPFLDGSLGWEEPRDDILNLIALVLGDGHPMN